MVKPLESIASFARKAALPFMTAASALLPMQAQAQQADSTRTHLPDGHPKIERVDRTLNLHSYDNIQPADVYVQKDSVWHKIGELKASINGARALRYEFADGVTRDINAFEVYDAEGNQVDISAQADGVFIAFPQEGIDMYVHRALRESVDEQDRGALSLTPTPITIDGVDRQGFFFDANAAYNALGADGEESVAGFVRLLHGKGQTQIASNYFLVEVDDDAPIHPGHTDRPGTTIGGGHGPGHEGPGKRPGDKPEDDEGTAYTRSHWRTASVGAAVGADLATVTVDNPNAGPKGIKYGENTVPKGGVYASLSDRGPKFLVDGAVDYMTGSGEAQITPIVDRDFSRLRAQGLAALRLFDRVGVGASVTYNREQTSNHEQNGQSGNPANDKRFTMRGIAPVITVDAGPATLLVGPEFFSAATEQYNLDNGQVRSDEGWGVVGGGVLNTENLLVRALAGYNSNAIADGLRAQLDAQFNFRDGAKVQPFVGASIAYRSELGPDFGLSRTHLSAQAGVSITNPTRRSNR